MAQIIAKYELYSAGDVFDVVMPMESEILHFSVTSSAPTIYARVFPESPKIIRRFRMVMTGMTVPEEGIYIGSATIEPSTRTWPPQAALEMHFFEIGPPSQEEWDARQAG